MTGDVREAITGVAGVSTVHVMIITPVIFHHEAPGLEAREAAAVHNDVGALVTPTRRTDAGSKPSGNSLRPV